MKYLFVVAHPDDECDGAGGTIHKLSTSGIPVAVAILAGKAEARRNLSDTIADDERKAFNILGIHQSYQAEFPNIKMNAVSNRQVVKFIRDCMEDWQADVVMTHHPTDTNNDHMVVSYATQEAFRRIEGRKMNGLYYLEASSATEWALNSTKNRFRPNTFVEIRLEDMEAKLKALDAYKNVSRPYPHPQCRESYQGLAAFRGAQSMFQYAEAFECVFRSVII